MTAFWTGTRARHVTGNDRQRLVFHGAIVLFTGLLCGIPALADELARGGMHGWRSAHLSLVVMGIWLVATGAILPSLVLAGRERSALVWSVVATAYGLMTTMFVQALTGARGVTPAGPIANWIAFAGNVVAILGALLAALLTLLGARAAVRGAPPAVSIFED